MVGKIEKKTSDDPEQSKRFVETAREVEADESEEGANRIFRKVIQKKTPQKEPKS